MTGGAVVALGRQDDMQADVQADMAYAPVPAELTLKAAAVAGEARHEFEVVGAPEHVLRAFAEWLAGGEQQDVAVLRAELDRVKMELQQLRARLDVYGREQAAGLRDVVVGGGGGSVGGAHVAEGRGGR